MLTKKMYQVHAAEGNKITNMVIFHETVLSISVDLKHAFQWDVGELVLPRFQKTMIRVSQVAKTNKSPWFYRLW